MPRVRSCRRIDGRDRRHAAQAAQAHDFIMAMPDGYDSRVEAAGQIFPAARSSASRLPRALLIDPSILVLDD